jgi:hypothetical protein
MQFLFPSFLWALMLLAIPVIIHLFYFRRFKKIYFTNVRFLKELKEETSSRSRIKNLLILLMRLLAFAALILAFAQPFLPLSDEVKQGRNAVSVFIDNSFSMGAIGSSVALLEMAKLRATEIIRAYDESDLFQMITHDLEGRHQRWVPKEEALDLIDEITVSPSSVSLNTIADRQYEMFRQNPNFNSAVFWISDFQQNMMEQKVNIDSTINYSLVPLSPVRQMNVGIDSVWMEEPVVIAGSPIQFNILVQNYGSTEASNVRLSFHSASEEKPVAGFSLKAGESSVLQYIYTPNSPGWNTGFFQITDYPVQFDDIYYISFDALSEINVLTISDGEPNLRLKRSLDGIDLFNASFLRSGSIDYAKLVNQDLIILDQLVNFSSGLIGELASFLKNGGKILLFPAPNAVLQDYNQLTQTLNLFSEWKPFEDKEREMATLNVDAFVFRDVFESKTTDLRLPLTRGNFPFPLFSNIPKENLILYRDGSPALVQFPVEQGFLLISSAPLSEQYSSLTQSSEVFIPLLYKVAILQNVPKKLNHWVGVQESILENHEQARAELIYKVKSEQTELIPGQRFSGNKVILDLSEGIVSAGIYDLFRTQNEVLSKYAFNYVRKESSQHFLSDNNLKELYPGLKIITAEMNTPITAIVAEQNRGIPLWKWFLLGALIALVIETFLLRFFREN